MDSAAVHFVIVTTDDRVHQLWAAATSRGEAVDRVLDAVPEGWAARLVDEETPTQKSAVLNISPGEVRELHTAIDMPAAASGAKAAQFIAKRA
jgi:hypothetical protein